MAEKRFTVSSFLKAKKNGEKISMLTAYDYSTAKLLDEAGVDSLLVGDSLGMVMLGYENTLQVTMDDMIHHCRAVSRGAKRAMVIGDMPFLSYHVSIEDSIRNAGRLVQEGGAHAVKLEGGREVLDKIKAIINAQIPVIGHLGLTPQSINMFGGFKVQGKNEEQAKKIVEDAVLLQEAGVFSIVLECVPEGLAKLISQRLDIPTIGIGAGKYCDGQVLVTQDMLGMYTDFVPKFVKQYSSLCDLIKESTKKYIEEIKEGSFPAKEHIFKIDNEVLEKLY
ncbi:3-methyl-2-oxobutanoate hydroxymethyltransferase [Paramaledivibacter caminithermalis]|uniref:3-methyl-2-oxobutanoate hydroxymethyltransferase n=1 Tax=Paramaledivibacter caminithermalis (strain DSM 15212 / CIP 107654 / DViRD3) TaxID=1121301 RepID=A0A1M6SLB8_PARC5|nr:3-methyl-2-oxobutanoate hydroxymethyltransferase [Paramaledivibacter caminithermalis]SHK45495.1 ketopantoate hydroxymethyltransferase [Paramaledivibacter caminithermalis DSM 15212]